MSRDDSSLATRKPSRFQPRHSAIGPGRRWRRGDVTVGDSLAQVLDADANITARCDLPRLETVTADDFPENLILPTSSSDGLETDLFNEIEIVSDDGNLRLDLSANIQTSIGRDVGA